MEIIKQILVMLSGLAAASAKVCIASLAILCVLTGVFLPSVSTSSTCVSGVVWHLYGTQGSCIGFYPGSICGL